MTERNIQSKCLDFMKFRLAIFVEQFMCLIIK